MKNVRIKGSDEEADPDGPEPDQDNPDPESPGPNSSTSEDTDHNIDN